MSVRPIPEGFSTVTPYLRMANAAAAIDYYVEALGAVESYRLADPSGKVMHAEIKIGNSILMMSDEFPEWGIAGPETLGGTATGMMIYVDDVDAAFAKALAVGGTVMNPVADQFYGTRTGKFRDPFGHEWSIGTQTEIVTPDEIAKRFEAWATAHASA